MQGLRNLGLGLRISGFGFSLRVGSRAWSFGCKFWGTKDHIKTIHIYIYELQSKLL